MAAAKKPKRPAKKAPVRYGKAAAKKAAPKKAKPKPKGPKVKKRLGRPPSCTPEKIEQARKLTSLTAVTDHELSIFFNVSYATIKDWKVRYPAFAEALKAGVANQVTKVEQALFARATGYTAEDVHISVHRGRVTQTKILKHFPPEVAAQQTFLYNRDPERWKSRQHHAIGGDPSNPTPIQGGVVVISPKEKPGASAAAKPAHSGNPKPKVTA